MNVEVGEATMLAMIIAVYAGGAVTVAAYAFYQGVLQRRQDRLLTATDDLLLGCTAVLVGVFWIFFMPALLVQWIRWLAAHSRLKAGLRAWFAAKKAPAST